MPYHPLRIQQFCVAFAPNSIRFGCFLMRNRRDLTCAGAVSRVLHLACSPFLERRSRRHAEFFPDRAEVRMVAAIHPRRPFGVSIAGFRMEYRTDRWR